MTSAFEAARAPQTDTAPDIINQLAGLAPDSHLAALRAQRPDVVQHAQGSYQALLEPDAVGGVSPYERELIALRVAAITATPALAEWHRARLQALGAGDAELSAIERFPDGGALPERQRVLLAHTDRVSREPRDSTPEDIAALEAVGLGPRAIVTVAQLISFLSFQVRTLAGLRILAEDQ